MRGFLLCESLLLIVFIIIKNHMANIPFNDWYSGKVKVILMFFMVMIIFVYSLLFHCF